MIHLDPALDQEFFNVAEGQSVSEIPPDSQHDDLRWEPVTRELGTIHKW